MSKDIDQIAAEAAEKIYGKDTTAANPGGAKATAAYAIIKAAIEKVDEIWRERFLKFEKIEDKFGPAKQRERSADTKRLDWLQANKALVFGVIFNSPNWRIEKSTTVREAIDAAIDAAMRRERMAQPAETSHRGKLTREASGLQ